MQGNLKQIQLPEVLQFISMGKSSGLLTVKGPTQETTLMIRSGRIINSSSLERQRRLGDLLVHRGILKRSVLTQVLNLQRTIESDKRLGQILVERDIIQESTIREVLRLQLEEEIWNLFGLEEGEFRFEQAADDKLGEASVQIDIEPLLLEGTRRQDEWRKMVRTIPSDRLIPTIKKPAADAEHRFKLAPQEWRVLAQINGRFPIRGVVNRSGMGRFEVYQVLCEFLRRGIVTIKKQDSAEVELPHALAAAQPAAAAKGGFGGLLSIFGGNKREESTAKLTFVTPIGGLAYFVTKLAEVALQTKEFKATTDDQFLLERAWTEFLIGFPKADLVIVEHNSIHTEELEHFLRLFEFGEAAQDCYEDSLEALSQLLDFVYRTFAARVGDKIAQKTVKELIDEVASRATYTYGSDFKLSERISMILRIAA